MTTKTLKVWDTSATPSAQTRTHEMLNADGTIKSYTFKYNEPLVLDEAEALRFNKDGFNVTEMDDTPYKKPVEVAEVVKNSLKRGETVARFEELSSEALKVRVALLPGGDKLAKAKKEEMIAFLTDANAVSAPAGNEDDLTEDDDDTKRENGTQPPATPPAAPQAGSTTPAFTQ